MNEYIGFYSFNQICMPITAAINISFTISSKDNANPNWYISFMTIIEKLPNLAMIWIKMISSSHFLEYLKNL